MRPIITIQSSNGVRYLGRQRTKCEYGAIDNERVPIATEILGKKSERGIIPLFIRMDEKQEVFWDLDLAERRKPRDEAIPEFGGNAALRGLLRPTPTEE